MLCANTSFAGRGNPFEIVDRLPEEAATSENSLAAAQGPSNTGNPFDLHRDANGALVALPAAGQEELLLVRNGERRAVLDARGRLLGIHLLMLLALGVLWTLFRPVLTNSYRALFNDSMLSQLHRKRAGGLQGQLLVCYGFSMLSIGFFLYLLTQHYDILPSDRPWGHWGMMSLGVAGLLGLKHLALSFYGWLWEVPKETGKYSFAVMVNALLLGMALVPANLLISYAPDYATNAVVSVSLALVSSILILRSLRGLAIANSFLSRHTLLFLLYICAIEIAPVALLVKFVSENL